MSTRTREKPGETSVDAPGGASFHRPARVFPEPIAEDPVVIASPPPVPQPTEGAFLQLLLPVVGSLSMIGFALIWRNMIFLIVAGSIAVLTIVLFIGIRVQQRRSAKKRRRENAARYRSYLAEQRERLGKLEAAQRRAAEHVHPDPERLWSLVVGRRRLWERRPGDADFLHVRVGAGDVPLAGGVRLDLGSDPLVEYEPDLLEEARELVDSHEHLELAPVTIPAGELGSLAVVGDSEDARALVRALLCELAAFHAPDDLRLTAYFAPQDEAAWGWLKWLPHTRDSGLASDETGRHTVGLTVDSADLEVLLTQLVRPRLDHLQRVRESSPYGTEVAFQPVVLVVAGWEPEGPLGGLTVLDELLRSAVDVGVLVIALVQHDDEVPSVIGARIELAEGGWLSYTESGPESRRERRVRAAAADIELCEAIARATAPLRLRTSRGRTATVDSEGLLDLLGFPSADLIRPAVAQERRDRATLLRSPIGIGEDGAPVLLDLKEAAEDGMGPHGLVVGATGSGKSELLRTLVTGLALTHSPEELAFVLVDYKGGATFADLEGLPHVAGMITNLERDLTLVDRMHEALFGELERRQRVLREAGIDRIRDYQERRAAQPELGLAPLPSLLLIVDEFGELLTNRPDFLELFVSGGRTGRSLGIHLLLATQRLDEGRIRGLEGHLRYRICLRTFNAEESMAVLGSREAFELPALPGIGLLRVDGVLQRFKAALSTRPYRERRPVAEEPSVVRAFTAVGPGPELAIVRGPAEDEARPELAPSAGRPGPARTEMEAAASAIARPAPGEEPARPVWLPPLPEALTLDDVLGRAGADAGAEPGTPEWLRVPIGLLDQPRLQSQVPLVLDFTGAGGHLAVVGAPRTGKSTLLQSLVASLALTHDPGDVHVYAIDLGGGGLHALASAPHVGAVHGRGDREGIERLVRELRAVVDERVALFRDRRLGGTAAYHEARRAGELEGRYGEVFLVVDNWAGLAQELPDIEHDLVELAAAGLHYGVHLVVSANRWNDIKLSLRDNLGGRLELRLNDPIESELDRQAAKALPEGIAGRGLTRGGEHFQAALTRIDGRADIGGLRLGLEGLVEGVAARWGERPLAPRVAMLPPLVTADDLPDPEDDGPGVALGLEEFALKPVRIDLFAADPHFLVFGDSECGKTSLLRGWMRRLAARYDDDEEVQIAVVDYRRQLLDALDDERLFGYACTPDMATELAGRLAAELAARLPSASFSPEELRQRRTWAGPELVLFVDDYDLVPGQNANPLAALSELLPQGRDVGFHAVVARRVGGVGRSAFEPFLQRLRELATPGVVMSGDPGEGPVLGARKAEHLPPGRGFLVRRRRSALVQTLFTPAPTDTGDAAEAASDTLELRRSLT